MISSYGKEKFRSFLLFAYKKIFYTFTHYYVTRKESQTETSGSMKSHFLFLEDDDDKKTAIYNGLFGYDYYCIGKPNVANLLYKNYRYCTSGYGK
jgi:hypothetical protein